MKGVLRSFLGCSETLIENFSAHGLEGAHEFLLQSSPIFESPSIFKADQLYRFPFTFILPTRLLPSTCQEYANEQIHDLHLQLPPSLRSACPSGRDCAGLDDLTTNMAKVFYSIEVTLGRRKIDHRAREILVKERCVHIRPRGEEQPPLLIERSDLDYCLSQEKTVRQSLLNRIGRLSMETHQPRYVYAGSQIVGEDGDRTSFLVIGLRFSPSRAGVHLPRLEKLHIKLKATTFYSAKPVKQIPSVEQDRHDLTRRQFSKTLSLAVHSLQQLQWVEHDIRNKLSSGVCSPQDSLGGSEGFHCPSSTKEGVHYFHSGTYYTAQVEIPIEIPSGKMFVPTFHSCLVSRIYALELTLSTTPITSLSLKVPLQIA